MLLHRLLGSFLLVVGLVACSPSYQLVDTYEPVQSEAQLSCVQSCDAEHVSCRHACRSDYDQCFSDAREAAAHELPYKLDAYESEYRIYAMELRRYRRELDYYDETKAHFHHRIHMAETHCHRMKSKSCGESLSLTDSLERLMRPDHPDEPSKPSLSQLTRDHARLCTQKCGCKERYKHCYISCGGRVTTKKVCLSNCS